MTKPYLLIPAFVVFVTLGFPWLTANSASFTEVGDAGLLTITANPVNTQPGGTPLNEILGTITDTGIDADVFKIWLTGGMTFTASTFSFTSNFFDTVLYLFDSTGLGIYANDDDPLSPPQSTLGPSSLALTPSSSGIYYLAISGFGVFPESSGGYIFPISNGLLDPGVIGPTGSGGLLPLSVWSGVSSEFGNYSIALTGAEFLPSAAIPEPVTFSLFAAGLVVAGLLRCRM